MLKFRIQAIAVMLVTVLSTANASVVSVREDVIAHPVARNADYLQDQASQGRMVRTSVDRAPRPVLDNGSADLTANANPYAMLVAGLAIMAVMARRRWRNQR